MNRDQLATCVACGQQTDAPPSPLVRLYVWGVRDFAWLRPTIICHQCEWDIQSKGKVGGVGWGWLQSKLPFPK